MLKGRMGQMDILMLAAPWVRRGDNPATDRADPSVIPMHLTFSSLPFCKKYWIRIGSRQPRCRFIRATRDTRKFYIILLDRP